MNIITLLEELATTTHHRININELISNQPTKTQEAFLFNDSLKLKQQLGNTENLADRSIVVPFAPQNV